MNKSPEEIKAEAAICLTIPPKAACNRLELYKDCGGDCRYVIKELYDLVLHLETRLAQAERERDAAIYDIRSVAIYSRPKCDFCKKGKNGRCQLVCIVQKEFEWRGVCEENSK